MLFRILLKSNFLHYKDYKTLCTKVKSFSIYCKVQQYKLFTPEIPTGLFYKLPLVILLKCLETGTIIPFHVKKTRRPVQRISKIECFEVFCYCRLPDDGREMACCDKCEEWYHMDYLKLIYKRMRRVVLQFLYIKSLKIFLINKLNYKD